MENVPQYITLDTQAINQCLFRIAVALEKLEVLASGAALQTPLNNPLPTLNLNSLNSSEDSEVKSRSGDKMQEKGDVQPLKRHQKGYRGGKIKIPEDFEFDDRAMQLGLSLGFTSQQVYQHFNAFRDFWRSEGRMKCDWQATFRSWLRKERRDHGDPRRGLR